MDEGINLRQRFYNSPMKVIVLQGQIPAKMPWYLSI